jgi:hypothetical protein
MRLTRFIQNRVIFTRFWAKKSRVLPIFKKITLKSGKRPLKIRKV